MNSTARAKPSIAEACRREASSSDGGAQLVARSSATEQICTDMLRSCEAKYREAEARPSHTTRCTAAAKHGIAIKKRKEQQMNKVILIGRLTADPEIRETQNGTPVARFTIAVNRRYKQEGGQQADFPVCIAWNKTAAFVADYFRKGKLIGIEGQLQTRSWEDNYGNRRYATEVVCDNVEFVGPKEQQSGGGYPYKGGNSSAGYQKPKQMKIDEFGLEEVSEDDLPF